MTESAAPSPTVVLIHGAFADGGSWGPVTEILQSAGVTVLVPACPLRDLASDSAYTASVFAQIPGPVLAVGHSYGGAVITNAASSASNVVGLVFVSGFAPEENEVLGEVEGTSRDSALAPALMPVTTSNGGRVPESLHPFKTPTPKAPLSPPLDRARKWYGGVPGGDDVQIFDGCG